MAGREIELLKDREQARERLAIWAGSDRPATIVRKELIDNEIDVVNEKGQRANSCTIRMSQNRMQVMDNGGGISTSIKEGTDKTHLWLACAKMFSGSNYEGESQTVGANGVGLTVANYTSRRFTIALINKNSVQGYRFFDGYQLNTVESDENLSKNRSLYDEDELKWVEKYPGDFVRKTLDKETFSNEVNFPYETGFFIDVTWNPCPNSIFHEQADLNWLIDYYARLRAAECTNVNCRITLEVYNDDNFYDLKSRKVYTKNKEWAENPEITYLKSWKERVEEAKAETIKNGPWIIAFSSDSSMKIESIVQGAPVEARMSHSFKIEIQNYEISVDVPITLFYQSSEYPPYSDQTKTNIRYPYFVVSKSFEKATNTYRHFYKEAEKLYLAQVIKDSDTKMYWPALGGDDVEKELVIAEGYSAISALKSRRDPMKQSCLALRGKILNCHNLDIQKAMNSDVIKQVLNAVLYNDFKRIIIAVDADPDGNHIAALLIVLLHEFTHAIEENKVYYVHTPHYLFKKKGKEIQWSDNAADCPDGYHVTTLKGLGGMTADQVEKFVMNEDSRELVLIKNDNDTDSYEALELAFSRGGEDWIIQ